MKPLHTYRITFTKGRSRKTATLVTSKSEADVMANKGGVLRYAFVKVGKRDDFQNWRVTQIETIQTI